MAFYIKKATGDIEEFDKDKLKRSLIIPGSSPELAEKIVNFVEKNLDQFKNTHDIYNYALAQLEQKESHIAARYNLKRALIEFGPTGFPFEKYIAQIFNEMKYETLTDQIIPGYCVDHEVDVVLKENNEYSIVECKFHNEQILKVHVQVILYTEARFHDIKKVWQRGELKSAYVITNTKFTYESIKYGNCKGIKLIGWNFPKENNLAQTIDKFNLYPITVLTSLSKHQKKLFLENGFVLCRDAKKNIDLISRAGIKKENLDKFIKECEKICRIY